MLWHNFTHRMGIKGDGTSSFVRMNCRLLDSDNPELTSIETPPENTNGLNYVAGLTASSTNPGETYLEWSAPSNDFEFVQIYWRRHRPNQDNVNLFWSQVICVRSDTDNYTHAHGLAADRVIYYRARIIDKKGRVSPWTSKLKLITI